MSIYSSIQWCDTTLNPVMGCDGCELFPKPSHLTRAFLTALQSITGEIPSAIRTAIEAKFRGFTTTEIYHRRNDIAVEVLEGAIARPTLHQVRMLNRAIADEVRCYAAVLHLRHGKDLLKEGKRAHKGYAPVFEQVTHFPGRMVAAARLKDLRNTCRPGKPWLDGARRLIFLSDMGDLLSRAVKFDYLRDEVLNHVGSPEGSRHVWLWLTKRPVRMAEFSRWLEKEGQSWPDNLIAMTSVTSDVTLGRVDQLKKVRCRYHGLSVEPLWSSVTLPLAGINWAIVGGESGGGARSFEIEWARSVRSQCRKAGTAFFLKQLGFRPHEGGNLSIWQTLTEAIGMSGPRT